MFLFPLTTTTITMYWLGEGVGKRYELSVASANGNYRVNEDHISTIREAHLGSY